MTPTALAGVATTGLTSTQSSATAIDSIATTTFSAAPGAGAVDQTNVMPSDGVWQTLGQTIGGSPAMQVASVQADAVHTTLRAAVVRIDQSKIRFRLVPGTQDPGNGPWPGGDRLTAAESAAVVAAFNSGFKMIDCRGGFAVGGRVLGSIRPGAATLVVLADGSMKIGQWGRDVGASDNAVAVRQNLDLIVDGGQVVKGVDDNTANRWGKTVGNVPDVWRSGIGIDAKGRIIYVASDGLSAKTLAALLQHAGAIRAMELDINHAWVSFNTFHHDANGQITGVKLLDGMKKPGTRYLTPDPRDYIAVVSRRPLAG